MEAEETNTKDVEEFAGKHPPYWDKKKFRSCLSKVEAYYKTHPPKKGRAKSSGRKIGGGKNPAKSAAYGICSWQAKKHKWDANYESMDEEYMDNIDEVVAEMKADLIDKIINGIDEVINQYKE